MMTNIILPHLRYSLTSTVLLCLIIVRSSLAVDNSNDWQNSILNTDASCDDKFIYFRLNFAKPFRGLIYTEQAFPQCVYVNGSLVSQVGRNNGALYNIHQLTYDVRIPLNECLTRRNSANGNYENPVVVQNSALYLDASDRKYLITCVPGANVQGQR
jgi:hypothetical protein